MAIEQNIKDKTQSVDIGVELEEFLTDLRLKVENDDSSRNAWKTKMVTANNQRLGVKRVTNKPYIGAPSIPLPLTDKLIRKRKPVFVQSVLSSRKPCLIRPAEGSTIRPEEAQVVKEKARKTEKAMNWLLRKKIDWLRKLTLFVDIFEEKGHAIFKVIEQFNSRIVHKSISLDRFEEEQVEAIKDLNKEDLAQFLYSQYGLDPDSEIDKKACSDIYKQLHEGKRQLEFDVEMVESLPDVIVPQPEKIVVPKSTTDIATATRIKHEYWLPRHILEMRAEQGMYRKSLLKDLKDGIIGESSKGVDSSIDTNKDRNEGVDQSGMEKDMHRIEEIATWYNNNGRWERWVFTFLADIGSAKTALIQKMPYPYEFETWNYIKHDHEVKDMRYHASRGTPEMIRAIQEFAEKMMNNRIIRDEINNAPMYTVLRNSKLQDHQVRFIPGQRIPVDSHDEIRPLTQPVKVDIAAERIEQMLKAYAEEYLGSTDQLFRNATNAGGGKTLGEIEQGIQMSRPAQNLEVTLFLEDISKLYRMIFDMFRERLNYNLMVEGEMITPEDFDFEPDIIANGSMDYSDLRLQEQKALSRMQLVAQWLQIGIADQEDAFNAAMDYLELEGIRDPEKYITKPEEIAKKALTQMNQQLQQGQKQLEEMQRQGERQHRKLLHMQDTLKTTGMKVQQKFKGPEKETTIKIGEGRG
jgi:hypothetical protein